MDRQVLNEIIECLPKGRTLFRYFRDRYALLLLQHVIGNGISIAQLKASRYRRLLDKTAVKEVLAYCGQGWLDPQVLDMALDFNGRDFVLTLGEWDGNYRYWSQTSRKGMNLVLQMNFSSAHDRMYRKLMQPKWDVLLNYYDHPVLKRGHRELFRETLAWARIDLDFTTGEALIEEIQSDWVRQAKTMLRRAHSELQGKRGELSYYGAGGKPESVIKYVEKVLKPYEVIWAEAMLAVTIDFIRRELGIKKIFYHTHETGCQLKGIEYSKPPVSLYSKLPRQFCFETTNEAPEFLLADKRFRHHYRKVRQPQWQLMDFCL